jgi:hypothetical protein
MKIVRVGLGRLFNADGFSLLGRDEILLPFPLGSIEVLAYIGRNPRHIIGTFTIGPRQSQDPKAKDSVSREYIIPSPEKFPADFYVELVAVQAIEVDDALGAAFHSGDMGARQDVLRKADERRPSLTAALDCVAGILGLRLHKILVTTSITEQLYTYRDNSTSYTLSMSLPVTVTESYELDVSDEDLAAIRNRIPKLKRAWPPEKAAEIFAWLLRAWAAEDSVLEFVSLFIPLELIIPNLPSPERNAWEQQRTALLDLIGKKSRSQELRELRHFVAKIQVPPPSLASRFENWAGRAALPGWREDVAAFRKFQRMRNSLVHAGEKPLKSRIAVGENDVRTLEDIAERYISLALFGDANIYESRKRSFMASN